MKQTKGKRKTAGLLAPMMLGITVTSGTVAAFGPKMKHLENSELMESSFENDDYEVWKEVIIQNLNRQVFEKERSKYFNYIEPDKVKESIKNAIDDKDYSAYIQATESVDSKSNFKIMNSEEFNLLVQIHDAKESGNYEILDELKEEFEMIPHIGQRDVKIIEQDFKNHKEKDWGIN